ncbi:HD-GYP domain-containing protein [Paenibacillus filicis]|uniref:HD-GYP domain-containing protein n=1 Tax=Paenibacillus gyeongsangnamensis TaxID=3388067 RepID=A0ABT4QCS9_9BACL|nr:HD-GYP domain-containing protein [Paenibacillus filicis]MCZ8514582.1 HD-GYP domain-containing protein [Paenibacillus filicis]
MKELLGQKVKYDVSNDAGLVIVPAETVIEQEHLELLLRHRVNPFAISVSKETPVKTAACSDLVDKTVGHTKELFQSIRKTGKIPLLEIRQEITPLVKQAAEHSELFELLEAVKAKDDYIHQHHIGVGIISTLIGKWMGLNEADLTCLTLAATLHDIGMIKVPDEILNKPGKLTEEEFKLMQKHTILGYEMLRETVGLQHRVALVALQHHEREDGSGYPLKLKSDKIDLLSKIVAVADTFHAMSSSRPYREPIAFHQIMSQMRGGTFGAFDPNIVSLFMNNMTRQLVGSEVILTDGRQGKVVYIHPYDDANALVQIDSDYVDLSRERHLHIKEVVNLSTL